MPRHASHVMSSSYKDDRPIDRDNGLYCMIAHHKHEGLYVRNYDRLATYNSFGPALLAQSWTNSLPLQWEMAN